MTNIPINKLVDERNQYLWKNIKQHYKITIVYSETDEYGNFPINNKSTISVAKNNLNPDSFTHELLHIYMRLHEIYIGGGITNIISSSNIMSLIFSENLLDHFGNSLDHIKMLPIYLAMGFNKEKFLHDYYEQKCTNEDISLMKKNYKIGKIYNSQAIDYYIGKYLAIMADPNDSFNYLPYLQKLKKIDSNLYLVLDKLIKDWNDFQIDEEDSALNDYHSILFDFYDGLKKWITNKRIE